jgi:cysteinyl-tRNA synthetase
MTIDNIKKMNAMTNVIFQDALAKNSARQIRLAFLLHAWNTTLDYSENVLKEAVQVEKLFNVCKNPCSYKLLRICNSFVTIIFKLIVTLIFI